STRAALIGPEPHPDATHGAPCDHARTPATANHVQRATGAPGAVSFPQPPSPDYYLLTAVSKSFYIIDGHAQIFRAYFAPFRDLTSPGGEPTKATYVFTQMLINLIAQRKPDYLAMVIDSGDETVFRKEIFPEYKSNRTPIPDDFFPQEQRILQVVKD